MFKRERWDRWLVEGAKDTMIRARERVKRILKENSPPYPVLDSGIRRQLDQIMDLARKRYGPDTLANSTRKIP